MQKIVSYNVTLRGLNQSDGRHSKAGGLRRFEETQYAVEVGERSSNPFEIKHSIVLLIIHRLFSTIFWFMRK